MALIPYVVVVLLVSDDMCDNVFAYRDESLRPAHREAGSRRWLARLLGPRASHVGFRSAMYAVLAPSQSAQWRNSPVGGAKSSEDLKQETNPFPSPRNRILLGNLQTQGNEDRSALSSSCTVSNK
jgi:hypothetical protein